MHNFCQKAALKNLDNFCFNSYGMSVAARQQINTKVKKTCHISGHSLFSGNSSDIIGEKCITNRNIEKITAKVKSMFRKSSKYMADQI